MDKLDKYRMLITGKNEFLKDNFFSELRNTYYMISSSSRYEDSINHIDLFDPHMYVICLSDETEEEMKSYSLLKRLLTSKDVITIVIGESDKIDKFETLTPQLCDLAIRDVFFTDEINQIITEHLEKTEQEYYEQQLMRERLEEIKSKLTKKHVLVVDDDPLMLKLIKEYLGEKYNVATAISGKVAHKFLETKETNLILLDYEMPEENGVEVLKKLRNNKELATVPVIFLTGVSDKTKLMEAISMKPQGYLLKPIDGDKLLGMVERFIG